MKQRFGLKCQKIGSLKKHIQICLNLLRFVLLSPYEPTILDDWKPSRKAGLRLDWPFQQELIQQQQCA